MSISEIPFQAIASQLLLGLVNGSFYAILSLGLALIFGLLNVANFAHGAFYMLGAFATWIGATYFGLGYWTMLLFAPAVIGGLGFCIERTMLKPLYKLDHLYGMMLTFGLTLLLEGALRLFYGVSGQPYNVPNALSGGIDLGFMILPKYRAWIVVISVIVCFSTWFAIERTKLGSHLRAAIENPRLVGAFGINVPLMRSLIFSFGAALAAFAGVLAAPVVQISPLMGSTLVIVIFAVVVIGGMGSIIGAIVTGLALGLIEGIARVIYPPGSAMVVYAAMILVLLVKPAGLFGRET
ncbi:MAG: branched-chain amino acid ABC transporter permease [Rhodospirillales bacterium]